jgi:hypothetical protein
MAAMAYGDSTRTLEISPDMGDISQFWEFTLW